MDLAALAMIRAEEQIARRTPRDADELATPFRRCPACGHRRVRDPRATVCGHCNPRKAGLRQKLKNKAPEPITEPCRALSCDRAARACGYCDTHYRQFRTHGRVGRINNTYQRSTQGEAA